MKKDYVLDTNVLIDSEKAIEELRNGVENNIFIPNTVLQELDKLKQDKLLRYQVSKVVKELHKHSDWIKILYCDEYISEVPDERILEEILFNKELFKDLIFVTNDELFRFKAIKHDVICETFKKSKPFKVEDEISNGFVDLYTEEGKREEFPNNTFHFDEKGNLKFYSGTKNKVEMVNDSTVWKNSPRDIYQKAFIHLMKDDNIDVISCQGKAGSGKTFLGLAHCLEEVLQEKKYSKICVIKPTIEIGEKLGYLPGDVSDKISVYYYPIKVLLTKLHGIRTTHEKIFTDETFTTLNNKKIEFLPIQFIRGLNIDNTIVLIDEASNFSRIEMRSILTRMGEKCKVIITGDIQQIDDHHLNEMNNGINWVTKICSGEKNYAHITLRGTKTRGDICDMITKVGL